MKSILQIIQKAEFEIYEQIGVPVKLQAEFETIETLTAALTPLLKIWGLSIKRLKGRSASRPITVIAYISATYLREILKANNRQIGKVLKRDQSTISYAFKQVNAWKSSNDEMFNRYYNKVQQYFI